MSQRNNSALVPYGQGGAIAVDVNHDGFADGGLHGAPSIAFIDTSQSQSVWVWIKVIPSLIRHQWATVFLALIILSVAIPTVFHTGAALLRNNPRYLEAKDGGAAGVFAPWVWVPNMITGVKQPVGDAVGKVQDAAIDNSGDTRAMAATLKSQAKVSIE